MTKIKEVKVSKENEDDEKVLSPQDQVSALLKGNKADHFNFEEDNYYKVPCSSLIANSIMNGGLASGAHRAIGNASGGKTSCSLDFMFHFFKRGVGHRGIYIKSEGRLSPEVQARSGIKFTNKIEEWEDGTCFILESNIYEFVFSFIGDLIRNNPTKCKYFFIIDSMDMMIKRDDCIKSMEDSNQVAGGALLGSTFMKKTAAALQKRGHISIFVSQVRDSIRIDPRAKGDSNKQGKAGGGHVWEHAADWVLDFGARYQDDIIREVEGDKNSKPIGHYCKINIVKSNNETYGQEIRYPIRYGRTGGTSVWVEKEVADMALMWNLVVKDKSSYYWKEDLYKELTDKFGADIPEKFVGIKKYMSYFDEKKDVVDFLYKKFQDFLK